MLLPVLAALSLALRKRLKVLGAQLKSGHLRLEQLHIALAVSALFTMSLLVGQKRAVEVRRSALCRQVHQRCAFTRSILRLAGSALSGILGAARRGRLVRQVVGSHAHRRQRHGHARRTGGAIDRHRNAGRRHSSRHQFLDHLLAPISQMPAQLVIAHAVDGRLALNVVAHHLQSQQEADKDDQPGQPCRQNDHLLGSGHGEHHRDRHRHGDA